MTFSLIRQGPDTRFGPSDEVPMSQFECPRLTGPMTYTL